MNVRRWLVIILGLLVVAGGVALLGLPELVRRTAIARIGSMTERPAAIDRVKVNVFTGWVGVYGLRLTERDGQTPFADFKRLDLRLHLPALLRGHLLLREVVLSDPTVRVVRLPTGEFNFSDMIHRARTSGRALDVTVERFRLTGGTATLEDQALPERRTWTSEGITIDARNVSTRQDDGHAIGRSVTGGAPVSVEVTDLRLYPVRLQAIDNERCSGGGRVRTSRRPPAPEPDDDQEPADHHPEQLHQPVVRASQHCGQEQEHADRDENPRGSDGSHRGLLDRSFRDRQPCTDVARPGEMIARDSTSRP